MWLSNAPGVHGVCSLAGWTLGSDETPTGFNIRAEASIGDTALLLSNKRILTKDRHFPHLS